MCPIKTFPTGDKKSQCRFCCLSTSEVFISKSSLPDSHGPSTTFRWTVWFAIQRTQSLYHGSSMSQEFFLNNYSQGRTDVSCSVLKCYIVTMLQRIRNIALAGKKILRWKWIFFPANAI